jgi:pectin methylesterase-like acyl-CoA thioesterase
VARIDKEDSGERQIFFITHALGFGLTLVTIWLLSNFDVGLSVARAADLHVCPSGCTYSSIQAAVDDADDGDVIKVATGVYTGVQDRPAPPGYSGPGTVYELDG